MDKYLGYLTTEQLLQHTDNEKIKQADVTLHWLVFEGKFGVYAVAEKIKKLQFDEIEGEKIKGVLGVG